MEAVSGMAQLIKAIMVLQKGWAPPNLHVDVPNPGLDAHDGTVVLPTRLTKLVGGTTSSSLDTRRLPMDDVTGSMQGNVAGRTFAAVHAYGVGGHNAHVILQKGELRTPTAGTPTCAATDILTGRQCFPGFVTRRSFPLHPPLSPTRASKLGVIPTPPRCNRAGQPPKSPRQTPATEGRRSTKVLPISSPTTTAGVASTRKAVRPLRNGMCCITTDRPGAGWISIFALLSFILSAGCYVAMTYPASSTIIESLMARGISIGQRIYSRMYSVEDVRAT
jgi:acyl transferase domain-containing protein